MGKQLLYRYRTGMELFHHFYYTIVQCLETTGQVGCCPALGGAYDTRLTDMGSAGPCLNEGVAGYLQTGIDTQYSPAGVRGRVL
jgi:hypothetical protein